MRGIREIAYEVEITAIIFHVPVNNTPIKYCVNFADFKFKKKFINLRDPSLS